MVPSAATPGACRAGLTAPVQLDHEGWLSHPGCSRTASHGLGLSRSPGGWSDPGITKAAPALPVLHPPQGLEPLPAPAWLPWESAPHGPLQIQPCHLFLQVDYTVFIVEGFPCSFFQEF